MTVKFKDVVSTAVGMLIGVGLTILVLSQTQMFTLKDADKDFINVQVETLQESVREIKGLNEKLDTLKDINSNLDKFNDHLRQVEDLATEMHENVETYEEMVTNFVKELQRLNKNLEEMEEQRHADSEALLRTIQKLEKRLNPFLGNDE